MTGVTTHDYQRGSVLAPASTVRDFVPHAYPTGFTGLMATRLSKRSRRARDRRVSHARPQSVPQRHRDKHTTSWLAKMVFMLLLFFVISVLVGLQGSFAADLGTQGEIYSIVEPDLLTGIQLTLRDKAHRGELAPLQQALVKRSVAHLLRPHPVRGVTDLPAKQVPVVRVVDPTQVIQHDVTTVLDGHLQILAHAGERINPLLQVRLTQTLLFINGDNAAQVAWVKQRLQVGNPNASAKLSDTVSPLIIILVNGNVKTVAEALQHRIYFDQFGVLCQRFQVHHTPTQVFQRYQFGHYVPTLVVEEVSVA